MLSNNSASAVINALIQCSAVFASSYGIDWAMYPVMGMVGYMVFMQSIAASSLFSGFIVSEENEKDSGYSISALVAILYLISSYEVYSLGYELFSGIMFAHSTIFLLTNLFGIIKLVKD